MAAVAVQHHTEGAKRARLDVPQLSPQSFEWVREFAPPISEEPYYGFGMVVPQLGKKPKPKPVLAFPHRSSKHFLSLQVAIDLSHQVATLTTCVESEYVPVAYSGSLRETPALVEPLLPLRGNLPWTIAEPKFDKLGDPILILNVRSNFEFWAESCAEAKLMINMPGLRARDIMDHIEIYGNSSNLFCGCYFRLATPITLDFPNDSKTYDPRFMDFETFVHASFSCLKLPAPGYMRVSRDCYLPEDTSIWVETGVWEKERQPLRYFLQEKFSTSNESKYRLEYFWFRLA